jgi:hypothetical protein
MLAMQSLTSVKLWVPADPASPAGPVRRSAPAATGRGETAWKEAAQIPWEPGSGWWLAFSPDGQTLAVLGNPGVTLWDMATKRPIATLKTIGPVVFSPDGQTLATGAWGSSIRLWDLATRRCVASLRGRAGLPWRFSPDGKTLAACSASVVTLWNLVTRREVAALRGHTGLINDVAFSPDGTTLASGSSDGTVRLWHAARLREADSLSLIATGVGDRSVSLWWRPVPAALGYRLYRGPAGATRSQLVPLTSQPLTATAFTDQESGLENGRTQTYGLAAVFPAESAGSGRPASHAPAEPWVEGPLVTFPATPAATPAGFLGYSINEGGRTGSVGFDATTGVITIRGSGADIWDLADHFYYLSRPVVGDFRATVMALTRPTAVDEWAKAALMLRDSIDPGARHLHLGISPAHGLYLQCRSFTNDYTDDVGSPRAIPAALKPPLMLRLIRQGDKITAQYSTDHGKSFRTAGDPVTFYPPLPRSVFVGLAVTAHNAAKVTEARFRDLRIEPLGH